MNRTDERQHRGVYFVVRKTDGKPVSVSRLAVRVMGQTVAGGGGLGMALRILGKSFLRR